MIMQVKWLKKQKTEEPENVVVQTQDNIVRGGNREIIAVTYIFMALFAGLLAYFLYFMIVSRKDVINNSYNQRQKVLAERTVRGKIYASDKTVLAETVQKNGKETRNYPFGREFCHVVGHSTEGKTGVELMENFNLLTSNDNLMTNMQKMLNGEKTIGDNVVTTLDVNLQKVAYNALGNFRGAVIVSEPKTGKVLAMVSKPDYDPNPSYLNPNWETLTKNSDDSSKLLNRATQGLYPPGSTFKMFTALEYMRQHEDYKKFSYSCVGKEVQDGYTVNCFMNHVHGVQSLKQAFANSCNSCFAYLGTQLDVKSFRKDADSWYFNTKLPTSFVNKPSSFVLNGESNKEEVMHTSMGQGKTQITPLHLNMFTNAVANGGSMMKSYVVDHLESNNGKIVRTNKPKKVATVIEETEAEKLTSFMKEVVKSGTATSLSYLSYSVAGKTGSAEYDSTKASHAWFTGFAPANDPKISVTVIVESMGTGSEYAVPIAKKIYQAYLGN